MCYISLPPSTPLTPPLSPTSPCRCLSWNGRRTAPFSHWAKSTGANTSITTFGSKVHTAMWVKILFYDPYKLYAQEIWLAWCFFVLKSSLHLWMNVFPLRDKVNIWPAVNFCFCRLWTLHHGQEDGQAGDPGGNLCSRLHQPQWVSVQCCTRTEFRSLMGQETVT